MTMISSTFGVSTMGLSSICAKTGLYLFPILLILATAINYCSYHAFIYLTHHYKVKGFAELSEKIFGKFKIVAIYSLILCNMGNMVANILIFNRYIFDLFKSFGLLQMEQSLQQNMARIVMILIFTLPFVLKRQLKDIFFVTYLTIIIMVFFIFFIAYQMIFTTQKYDPTIEYNYFNPSEMIQNYSYLFFCYVS